jgi:hypothetical protein
MELSVAAVIGIGDPSPVSVVAGTGVGVAAGGALVVADG